MAQSFLPISPTSDFSLANIPWGIISRGDAAKRVPATIVGEYVLDLAEFAAGKGFSSLSSIQEQHLDVFQQPTLNAFARLGRPFHRQVRSFLQEILKDNTKHPEALRDNEPLRHKCLIPSKDVQTHLPLEIGDFTDCYGGLNHAVNAGALYRGQKGALLPNFLHLPMAYHGRSSSIYVSGTSIRRPWGQVVRDLTATPKAPAFEKCETMDFELELGAFICRENPPGESIPVDEAEEAIFGHVLVNDWSARDIQRWEYVPLGPFNGKNFATTISPWVISPDALAPFRARGLENSEQLLPYLRETRKENVYNLTLEVILTSGETGHSTTICKNNAAEGLVWSFQQMLAHHTSTGCPMRAGDLLGSGTISGVTKDSLGCLLEQSSNGKEAITLSGGEKRTWLQDGDGVTLRAYAGDEKTGKVGFGECTGKLLPSLDG